MASEITRKEREYINKAWANLLGIADKSRRTDRADLEAALRRFNKGRDDLPLAKLLLCRAAAEAHKANLADLWAYDHGYREVVLFAVFNSDKMSGYRSDFRKVLMDLHNDLIARKFQ